MRRAAALLLLALTACGGGSNDDSTVRRYEDVAGQPVGPEHSLGFTYYAGDGGAAEHGAPGWNHLINEVLWFDDNPLRLRDIVAHELGQRFVLKFGEPVNITPAWYTWDGDTKAGQPMDPDEAAWFAAHGPYRVHVSDAWLEDAVDEALDFINGAAGTEVFHR